MSNYHLTSGPSVANSTALTECLTHDVTIRPPFSCQRRSWALCSGCLWEVPGRLRLDLIGMMLECGRIIISCYPKIPYPSSKPAFHRDWSSWNSPCMTAGRSLWSASMVLGARIPSSSHWKCGGDSDSYRRSWSRAIVWWTCSPLHSVAFLHSSGAESLGAHSGGDSCCFGCPNDWQCS
jgi:hypothetical protein